MFSICPPAGCWRPMFVVAFDGLAYALAMSSQIFLIEQHLCRSFYAATDPTIIRPDGSVPEHKCKMEALQSKVAFYSGLFDFSIMTAGFLVAPLYTRLASIVGKRSVLLLNMKSYALRIAWFVSVFYFHTFFNDIRWVYLTCVFDLIGGGESMREIILWLYVAESIPKEEQMTNTFNVLSASLIGMMSIGTFVGAQLLKFNVWLLCLLIVCAYVLLIACAYLLPHQRHDDLSDRSYIERETASVEERCSLVSTDSTAPSPTRPLRIESPSAGVATKPDSTVSRTLLRAATVDIYLSVELVIQTVRHPFTRHVMILFFAYTLAGTISGTSPQWASSTFNARLANVDQIRGMEMIISALVLVSLPVLSSYVLRPWLRTKQAVDIWVITASMLALLTGTLIMAMAPSLVVYAIGVAISALGVGVSDALRSFATSVLSDGDALERLYVCIRTMQSLASIAGTPLWSGFFLLILSNPLLPHALLFLGNAFVYLVCLILAGFLHW